MPSGFKIFGGGLLAAMMMFIIAQHLEHGTGADGLRIKRIVLSDQKNSNTESTAALSPEGLSLGEHLNNKTQFAALELQRREVVLATLAAATLAVNLKAVGAVGAVKAVGAVGAVGAGKAVGAVGAGKAVGTAAVGKTAVAAAPVQTTVAAAQANTVHWGAGLPVMVATGTGVVGKALEKKLVDGAKEDVFLDANDAESDGNNAANNNNAGPNVDGPKYGPHGDAFV